MREPGCRERAVIPIRARSGIAALARTPVIPEATPAAQLRRPRSRSATAGLRRLRPSLGNDCRIFTAGPLAPYAPKAKTASECGEVPHATVITS